jgi:hypothetical protein
VDETRSFRAAAVAVRCRKQERALLFIPAKGA